MRRFVKGISSVANFRPVKQSKECRAPPDNGGNGGNQPDLGEILANLPEFTTQTAGNLPKSAGNLPKSAGNLPRSAGNSPRSAGKSPRSIRWKFAQIRLRWKFAQIRPDFAQYAREFRLNPAGFRHFPHFPLGLYPPHDRRYRYRPWPIAK